MTDQKLVNRIPFEEITDAKKWAVPSLGEGREVVSSVKRKTAPPQPREIIEDVAPVAMRPMTADQLAQITEQAERDGYDQGYQQGLAKGYAEGEQKGRQEGERKAYTEVSASLEDQKSRFLAIADALLNPMQNQDDALENTILHMAVHLAKHLLNRELTEDPTALFHVVERAVASLPAGAPNIRIYLHSDDVELAHEAFANQGRNWTFFADAQLSRGGCRVETDNSLVDYSVERRLQRMLDEVNFLGELDESQQMQPAQYRPAPAHHSAAPDDNPAAETQVPYAQATDNQFIDQQFIDQQFTDDPFTDDQSAQPSPTDNPFPNFDPQRPL